MKQSKPALRGIAVYSLLFLLALPLCWLGLILSGRMPIWEVDGQMQYYPFFVYIGQWLRDAIHAAFTGGTVRMFDFSLGLGEDVLTVINYYGLGDPLSLIAALFAGASTEAGFMLLTVLRPWCAGLACMALARNRGFDWKQTVYAGLLYAFSLGLLVLATLRHAIFANPFIHLPLILLGMEHVFDRRRPWLLSLAVALSALCGFYFLYCNSLLLLIYALVRQLTRGAEHPVRGLPAVAARAVGWYLLGLGLAAAIFLPATAGFLGGQRLSGALSAADGRFHFSLRTYLQFPMAMLSDRGAGAVQFVPAATVFGGALLLCRGREARSWRALMLTALAMLMIPATGWVLNGFSYEATRWSYAVSLLAAMVGGRTLGELLNASRHDRLLVTALGALLLAYLPCSYLTGLNTVLTSVMIATFAVAATLAALWLFWTLARRSGALRRITSLLLACVVLVNVALGFMGAWRVRAGTYIRAGDSWKSLEASPFADLPDAGGRTDADITTTGAAMNSAAVWGVAGATVYNSTISETYYRFWADMTCSGLVHMNCIVGLDGRAALEALWSASRYVAAEDWSGRIPYGFEYAETTDSGYNVYENTLALPIGYAMTETLSPEDYAALSPLEKQWALLQCTVLEDCETTRIPEQSATEIPIEAVEMEGVAADGNRLTVSEDAVIRLTFDAPADCELYLQMNGLAFLTGELDLENRVLFRAGASETALTLVPHGIVQDLDREYYLVNLGYDEDGRSEAEIRFEKAGVYRLGEMTLYAQPMADFAERIHALQARGLTDVSVNTNAVAGRISLDAPGVLVFAIPYSSGWTVRVDGVETKTQTSAGTFLSAKIDAGDHEISLVYRTPWLRTGAAVSALSLVLLIGIIIAGRRRRSAKGA